VKEQFAFLSFDETVMLPRYQLHYRALRHVYHPLGRNARDTNNHNPCPSYRYLGRKTYAEDDATSV
jgi:hypothetical protein